MQQYTTLIAVDQLASLMATNDAHPLLVCDCRFSLSDTSLGRNKYETEHIPSAIYVHLEHVLAAEITPHSGRHPLPKIEDFIQRVSAWGVHNQTQIVVYDDAGGAIAARLWWMMKWIGHTRVAVLDGGYAAWQHSGQPISKQVATSSKTAQGHRQDYGQDDSSGSQQFVAKPNKSIINQNMVVETAELLALLKSNRIHLYDARAEPRFVGKHEPIDTVAGHIPGAINLPFERNLDEQKFFLPTNTLKQRFAAIATVSNDGDATDTIVHMCGSGVTACHNILAMEIADTPSRLYVGSWSEWIRDPDRAVASMTEERE